MAHVTAQRSTARANTCAYRYHLQRATSKPTHVQSFGFNLNADNAMAAPREQKPQLSSDAAKPYSEIAAEHIRELSLANRVWSFEPPH